MRFLMLGPLDVVGSDGQAIRAAKHRGLLATLVINSNHVVPVGSLIDALWSDAPPTALNLIRQYVSRLRKALAPGRNAGVELATHGSGYTLVLPPRATDIEDFEDLIALARNEFAAGRPLRALEMVERALKLWRGSPFADVPCGLQLAAEQARLEEMRASALELHAEATLSAGQVDRAVSELTALTVQYPFREATHGRLMHALSASGRKADALAVYQKLRRTTVAELGLEPGRELKDLEQSILNGGGGVEIAREAIHVDVAPVREDMALTPPQLPPALNDFVGREEQSRAVGRLLGGQSADIGANGDATRVCPPIVVLCGLAGVGKTSLAIRLGHELGRYFPDGQLLLSLASNGDAVDPVDVLGQALELLGRPARSQPPGLLARQHLFRGVLAERRMLLVLDGAVDEPQVRELLPGRTGSAVLVTSRSKLAALDGARHVPLPMFTTPEAVRLLAEVVGPDRVAAEPEAARAIGMACDGLPLAVRAAGAVLGQLPHRRLGHLVDRMDGDRIFDELVVGDLDVGELVGAAYGELRPDEQQLLVRLAMLCDQHGLVGEDQLRVPPRLVDRCVEAAVLEYVGTDPDGQAVFRSAGLLRRYARLRARRPTAQQGWYHRTMRSSLTAIDSSAPA